MTIGLHKILTATVTGALIVIAGTTFAATVHVTSDERSVLSIQAGIDAAAPGDTVRVAPGIWTGHGLTIDHPLTLIGDPGAVIDAGNNGEIITIRSDDVRVSGLELRNVGTSFMEDRAAIRIVESTRCTVSDNVLSEAFFGIYVENSRHCTISGNRLQATGTRESMTGNGIHLWHCAHMSILNNEVRGHRDGIYFEFVDSSHVVNNFSTGNLRYGLHFMFSQHDEYRGNRFVANGAGVAVMYSHDVTMRDNHFEKNWGPAAYGLLLKEIHDSTIFGNDFTNNTIGIYSEGCGRLRVERNDFRDNGYGIRVMANSMDNVVTRNNFIGNSFDVTTNGRQNFNTFDSNYWSDYDGYDLDRDGVGDIPYHPVRLFALLIERQPSGVILLESLFVRIIDTVERVMPVFTPETLVDRTPLTRRVDRR